MATETAIEEQIDSGPGAYGMGLLTVKKILQAAMEVVREFQRLASERGNSGSITKFHRLFYESHGRTPWSSSWLGIPVWKCPLDLWVYQEIISESQPDVIIESGTALGGSALFLASILELINKGRVVTIDIQSEKGRPQHERITYLHGSSTSEEIAEELRSLVNPDDKVMVVLDSDHRKSHVLEELAIYSKLVTNGSYLIVEDTNLNGHPVVPEHGPGPMEAVEEFLTNNKDFIPDKGREKFYLTYNPGGYLKRIN